MAQEKLIRDSGIPYTIVHSTQFFEFLGGIAQSATVGNTITLPSAFFQPIASDDVADIMTDVAPSAPINGVIEIGGPEPVRMSDLVAQFLKATGDPRNVVGDPRAKYFGTNLMTAPSSPAPTRASERQASNIGSTTLHPVETDLRRFQQGPEQ